MYKDTKRFVRSCTVCLSRRNAFKIPPAPHQPVEQSQEPGETCHIEIFGPLKTTLKGNFLLIVDGLQTFDVLPSSTGDSSTHRGRTADILMCCPAGAPNFLRSVDASAIFLVGTHMIAKLFSRDGTIFFFLARYNLFCAVYLKEGRSDGRLEFPNLELAPEMA
ncbi:integrase_H2C2 domain-containing protein [Trichonephila clavipes]|nr:integrase_H2C2 domain-containing protein [Trichonephila clavipes]